MLSNTRSNAKTVVGTPYYLSPEIIESSPYSFKSDIWSLGVLLYEMCALMPHFNAQSLHQLAQKIVQAKYDKLPRQYSAQLNQLLTSMLLKDPRRRPNINEVLNTPLLKKRIPACLGAQDFKDEFSHTLMHNHNVFQEFQKLKQQDSEAMQK